MLLRNILTEQLLSTPEGTEVDLRNTPVFYILRANSFLSKFYADLLRGRGANPCFVKDLETQSGFFFTPDQSTKKRSSRQPGELLDTFIFLRRPFRFAKQPTPFRMTSDSVLSGLSGIRLQLHLELAHTHEL